MITVNIIPPPREFLSRHDTQDRYVFSSLFCPALLFRRMMRSRSQQKNAEAHVLSVFVLSAVRDPHSGNFDDERLLS